MQSPENPSGVMALGGKSMTNFFTSVLLHHSERRLGFSLCQHMVVESTRLTFTQPLSLGFEQGVSGTCQELAETDPVPKNLPPAVGYAHQAAPSSCTFLL